MSRTSATFKGAVMVSTGWKALYGNQSGCRFDSGLLHQFQPGFIMKQHGKITRSELIRENNRLRSDLTEAKVGLVEASKLLDLAHAQLSKFKAAESWLSAGLG